MFKATSTVNGIHTILLIFSEREKSRAGKVLPVNSGLFYPQETNSIKETTAS